LPQHEALQQWPGQAPQIRDFVAAFGQWQQQVAERKEQAKVLQEPGGQMLQPEAMAQQAQQGRVTQPVVMHLPKAMAMAQGTQVPVEHLMGNCGFWPN
jgi:hypothetical protein